MKFAISSLSAAVLAVAVSSQAFAYSDIQHNGFYISGGYGIVDNDLDEVEDYVGLELSDPNAFSLTLGYRINSWLAAEIGYIDLGSADVSASDQFVSWGPEYAGTDGVYDYYTYDEITESGAAEVSATAVKLGGVISTNVWETVSIGLRLGVNLWDAEVKANYDYSEDGYLTLGLDGEVVDTINWDSYSESFGGSEDGSDFYYGLTAGWRSGNLLLSLDHTFYEMDDIKPSVTSLTLGLDF